VEILNDFSLLEGFLDAVRIDIYGRSNGVSGGSVGVVDGSIVAVEVRDQAQAWRL
jgi:hypothetical protein